MHNIVLNSNDNTLSQGYHVLKRNIINSGIFDVAYDDLPISDVKYRRKEEGFSIAIINGVKIIIDANGGCHNIKAMYEDGAFDREFFDVRVIVKTQYKPCPFWNLLRQKGFKIVSWIMWSTDNFPLECFKWHLKDFKYTASCAGGPNSNKRWGRPPYIKWCESQNDFHTQRQKVNDFVEVLKQCKWGLILQGGNRYNCDGKNTREVEYASCGMPMVLNYIPNYEYEFEPDKHFLYLEHPDDLQKLRYLDPKPFAKKSLELWNNYLKPKSAGEYLIKLIYE